jgi:hypothetical protein
MTSAFDAGSYFSEDYDSARRAFLTAVLTAGAELHSHEIRARGPGGAALYIDEAYLGPDDLAELIILTSGVHGVEGYVGSAWQRLYLTQMASTLPPTVGVLLVHAVNPYGFAWGRRVNENNVDLNRNAVDHFPGPVNPVYRRLQRWLGPGPAGNWRVRFWLEGLWQLLCFGPTGLRQAIAGGQYEFPQGLFYGGHEPQESLRVLEKILSARRFAGVRRVAHLDLHSGLGKWGALHLFSEHPPGSAALARWTDTFGSALVSSGHTTEDGGYHASGVITDLTRRIFAGREVFAAVLEAGTLTALRVLHALQEENWRHFHHPDSSREPGTPHLCRVFCPPDADWRARVLMQGSDIMTNLSRLLHE